MSWNQMNYQWSFNEPCFGVGGGSSDGHGDTEKDCVRRGLDWWRYHCRGTSPITDFSVRERGASKCNWRPFSEWLDAYGLVWPQTPWSLFDGSCGRCDRSVYKGHTSADHWHCKCGTGFDRKSFRFCGERGCGKCSVEIPHPSERFIFGFTHGSPLEPQLVLCIEYTNGRWKYPLWRAKRVQEIKFALDLVESPELTGNALKLAEMRENLASGFQFVAGIYGAADPGIEFMNEGQLLDLKRLVDAKDRDNLRRFHEHVRSQLGDSWGPRMGYSSSGG